MTGKEKATAPVSSVGADGKQPLCKNNKESRGIIRMCEQVAASGNILILYSA